MNRRINFYCLSTGGLFLVISGLGIIRLMTTETELVGEQNGLIKNHNLNKNIKCTFY